MITNPDTLNVSVKPMLDVAEITSEVVYTEYSGHARDYVQDCKDIYKYSAIMTVSGGLLVNLFGFSWLVLSIIHCYFYEFVF